MTTTTDDWPRAELLFTPPDQYVEAVEHLVKTGARTFVLRPNDTTLAARLNQHFGSAIGLFREPPRDVPVDAVLIPPLPADQLNAELLGYLDRPRRLVAPVSERHIGNHPVFTVTIPKAGTHLLFHLFDAFGLAPGGPCQRRLDPGSYYFLAHEHSHLPAEDFFAALANEPHGGIHHPFFSHPAVFIYRNPMDIVVSEAFYYTQREKTALAYYFEDMTVAERCLRLILDDPLLRSIRDRVIGYAPWLRLKNVIPVSYEELVGARGGGSDLEQYRTIWSLQLKLHIPGVPVRLGARMYTEKSATFRKGRVHGHKEHFEERHYVAFRALPQDFMHEFGYAVDDTFGEGYVPRLVEIFRRRPLRLEPPSSEE
jgi:hypothetical protein